jgi:leucine-rich repeat protein SHOC2
MALRTWREQCPELRALWDEAAPVTEWKGITLGEAGDANAVRVVKINIINTGLSGDVPAALGSLTALNALSLGGNELTSVPKELGGLTALKTLNLSGNQLTSVPAALGLLSALRTLNLSGNQLTSLPAAFGGLTALTEGRCRLTQ